MVTEAIKDKGAMKYDEANPDVISLAAHVTGEYRQSGVEGEDLLAVYEEAKVVAEYVIQDNSGTLPLEKAKAKVAQHPLFRPNLSKQVYSLNSFQAEKINAFLGQDLFQAGNRVEIGLPRDGEVCIIVKEDYSHQDGYNVRILLNANGEVSIIFWNDNIWGASGTKKAQLDPQKARMLIAAFFSKIEIPNLSPEELEGVKCLKAVLTSNSPLQEA